MAGAHKRDRREHSKSCGRCRPLRYVADRFGRRRGHRILYALGLQKQIVAVDSTSLFPRDALKEKTNVGYLRQLSPEGVLGLNPTVIIAAEGAGPKETVEVIEQASIPFVHVPDHFSGDGIVEKSG